ncbi:hypothetical protein ILT44_23345 [Microvirga sp. BT689]|uniref:hypothetical protein n=1 Tax=Microvirga arvi TaxID=2778731 RepID=UPI0019517E56|nr:hypothetical protein [Microvirga arvi]MBM6583141.1 hypothetical protein [Microvirga arvi]
MASITTWARIEPHAATTDIDVGLAAEVADPMWLLARQLQLGEFTGDDGGSPVDIQVQASWSQLARFRPGLHSDDTAGAIDYDPTTLPLEPLIEAEPIDPERAWGISVRSGLRLEQDLQAGGLGDTVPLLRTRFPFAASFSRTGTPILNSVHEERYAAVFGGKVTDGLSVRTAHANNNLADIRAAGDVEVFDKVLREWISWLEGELEIRRDSSETRNAWQPKRLEYAFSISSPGFGDEIAMTASEYDGSGLDWYHVDRVQGTLGPIGTDANAGILQYRLLPKSVTFPGMPGDRFWEMEDGLIDLGSIDAGPTDLARMLATEYAVIYSPDWFMVPVELPVGSVARIEWIVVTDTFGVATCVGTAASQAHDQGGRMFQLSTVSDQIADEPFLLIAPATLYGQQSAPLEDVLLQRDEQANLAWAIEKLVLGPAGRAVEVPPGKPEPLDLQDYPAEDPRPDLIYQVATWVPNGWQPLVAVPVEGGAEEGSERHHMLERALLLETDALRLRLASGQLAAEIDTIFEEEVRRDGLRLQMVDQLVRWTDGSTHLWRGRQKKAGRGESHAGLYFDKTSPPGR